MVILSSAVSHLRKIQTIILSTKSFSVLYVDSHITYSQSSSFTTDGLQLTSVSDACSSLLSVKPTSTSILLSPSSQAGLPLYHFLCPVAKKNHTASTKSPLLLYLFQYTSLWFGVKLPVAQVIEALLQRMQSISPGQLKQHLTVSRGVLRMKNKRWFLLKNV